MKSTICILLVTLSFTGFAQKPTKPTSEGGILVGIGYSGLLNSNINSYYKKITNNHFESAVFYRKNYLNNKLTIKYEYNQKAFTSKFQFNETNHGIAEQGLMGFSAKWKYNKNGIDKRNFELLLGAGLYTILGQRRVPDPFSGLQEIDDGYFSYCGVSFDFEFSYGIPLDKYTVGAAWRFSILPNLTFFNRNNVPEFYHAGSSIAIYSTF